MRLREPVNSLTHLAGAILAVLGTMLLLVRAEDGREVFAFTVYGTSLVALFSASTALHAVTGGEARLRRLRILDHAAIFVLIAGSYTPVTLLALREVNPPLAWTLFALSWLLAILGVVFKLFWIAAPRVLSTALYLAMGWLAVVGVVPLARALPSAGMVWLAVGGVFYSVGAVIYAIKRPDPLPGVLGYHEIWHLFVLAGAASHYLLMLLYI